MQFKCVKIVLVVGIAALACAQTDSRSLPDIKSLVKGSFSEIFGALSDKLHLQKVADNISEKPFQKFMQLYNKAYNGTEMKKRFAIFKSRVKMIVKSKIDYLEGRSTWTMGINQFADRTDDELKFGSSVNMTQLDDLKNRLTKVSGFNISSPLTESRFGRWLERWFDSKAGLVSTDWRDTNCVMSPRSQGECGACYAFSTMSVLETMRCLKTGELERLAPQMLVDCMKSHPILYGCNGGNYLAVYMFLADINMIASEQNYGYRAKLGICQLRNLARQGKTMTVVPGGSRVVIHHPQTWHGIAEYVMKSGPMMAQAVVNSDFKFYARGIFKARDCAKGEIEVAHALTIVGLGEDSSTGKPYWIVKNSWSELWGEGGYAKIELGKNACQIENVAVGLTMGDES